MAASKTKEEQVAFIKEQLEENQNNLIMARYTGLSVQDMADLRGKLREKGLGYKVIKNNLFMRAWSEVNQEENKEKLEETIVGQLGVTFGGENLPLAAKIYKEYRKENEKFEIVGGIFDGEVLDHKGVEGIAGLPTREELLATIAMGLNSPVRNTASLVNEVMASLARAINSVGEKNG